jgi:23S rRNA (cytosine1962-C5)-methyltransferase
LPTFAPQMSTKKIILKHGKEEALNRRHPWIFSGAVFKAEGNSGNGEIVHVYSGNGDPLATGFYARGSIAIRLFDFAVVDTTPAYWASKLKQAIDFRKNTGLYDSTETNVFRLFNAEGDGIPGLVIDFYNGVAVIQCHTPGTYALRNKFTEALKETVGKRLKAVYDKSAESLGEEGAENGYLYQAKGFDPDAAQTVQENGLTFEVDWVAGQKTGFFIDQRDNRALLGKYAKGKKVLNTFCYTGGFSVYALQAGATLVHSVDSSLRAVEQADRNVDLNIKEAQHESFTDDVFSFFKNYPEKYDVIVLDPPAFAKHMNARHSAIIAYKRLNAEAFKRINKGGVIFTFSCSGVVTRELFEGAVTAAAIEAGRNVRVLTRLGQPLCHPVSIFHSEGEYLKGLVLYVE